MNDDLLYKVYITDSLKGIYKSMGGNVRARFYDIIEGNAVEDDRTPEEIIEGIRAKLDDVSEV